MTLKVGFIGLGIMGKPMSKNLIKAGYSLVVSDHNPQSVAEVMAAGAETAATPKAIAEQCDVIITMLPNSRQRGRAWGERHHRRCEAGPGAD